MIYDNGVKYARKLRFFTIFACTLSLVLGACQRTTRNKGTEVRTESGSYRVVSVQELQSMLEEKDFTMINVQIPWQGDIPQTDLRMAYDQVLQNQDQLSEGGKPKILVYCLTSGMARIAAESLVSLGYINVWMLEGGTIAWEEAGLRLTR